MYNIIVNKKLSAIRNISKNHHSVAVLMPGFLDSNRYIKIEVMSKGLNELGYSTICLDPCGLWYGDQNEENYTVTGYLNDVSAALNDLLIEIPAPKDVLLIGHSLGGNLSIIAASMHDEVKTVCALCAPNTLSALSNQEWKNSGRKVSQRIIPENRESLRTFVLPYSFVEDATKYSAMEVASKVRAKTLFVIALEDTSVTPDRAEALAHKVKNSRIIRFPNMDHHFNRTYEDTKVVWEEIKKFLLSS